MATPEMCVYCFDHLHSHLFQAPRPGKPSFTGESFPLFVTWNMRHHNDDDDYRLRGCIGTFSARPLHDGLAEYALTSAVNDSRFRPVSRDEFPSLKCSVSLLTDFEPGTDYLDWEIGTHGIWIEFQTSKGPRTATYLPEVTPEQGWTKVEAIDSLLRKGKFAGAITDEVRRSIKLTRYQTSKAHLTHDQWASQKN